MTLRGKERDAGRVVMAIRLSHMDIVYLRSQLGATDPDVQGGPKQVLSLKG